MRAQMVLMKSLQLTFLIKIYLTYQESRPPICVFTT